MKLNEHPYKPISTNLKLHEGWIYVRAVVLDHSSFSEVLLINWQPSVFKEKRLHFLTAPSQRDYKRPLRRAKCISSVGSTQMWCYRTERGSDCERDFNWRLLQEIGTVTSLSELAGGCSCSGARLAVVPHRLQWSKQLTQQVSEMRKYLGRVQL